MGWSMDGMRDLGKPPINQNGVLDRRFIAGEEERLVSLTRLGTMREA